MDNNRVNLALIVALSLVGMLANSQVFRSPRPQMSTDAVGEPGRHAPATEWGDPLRAIRAHQQALRAGAIVDQQPAEIATLEDVGRFLQTQLNRIMHEDPSPPGASPERGDLPPWTSAIDSGRGDMPGCSLGAATSLPLDAPPLARSDTQLLIGFLDSYPDPASADRRREDRVAVRSALARAGYTQAPAENRRYLTYLVTEQYDHSAAAERSPSDLAIRDCVTIPYSIFKLDRSTTVDDLVCCPAHKSFSDFMKNQEEQPRYVILLWLWNDRVRNDRLHETVLALANAVPARTTAVLGPPESESLIRVVEEIRGRGVADSGLTRGRSVVYYSAYSTIDPETLFEYEPKDDEFNPFLRWPTEVGASVAVQRVIATDKQLITSLGDELRRRQVTSRRSTIAVVSPLSSLYAREMAAAEFRKAQNQSEYAIRRYSYLSNLENDLQDSSGDRGDVRDDRNRNRERVIERLAGGQEQRPAGRSQLDAVERMVEQIERDHRRLSKQGEPIRAIFLAGGDIYDKLTILRALEGKVPGALRMTTDLYAIYAHEQEQPVTRGLIVASGFGLRLGPYLQGQTPPFRTNYQTAAYFAALAALHGSVLKETAKCFADPGHRHRLYEIARSGPYALGSPMYPDSSLLFPLNDQRRQRWTNTERIGATLAFIILWLSSAAAACSMLRHRELGVESELYSKRSRVYLSHAIGVGFALTVLAASYIFALRIGGMRSQEPFEWFSGVSAWPGTLIRIFTVVLGIALLLQMLKTFRRSDALVDELTESSHAEELRLTNNDPLVNTIRDAKDVFTVGNPAELPEQGQGRPLGAWRAIIALLIAAVIVAIVILAGVLLLPTCLAVATALLFIAGWATFILVWLSVGMAARWLGQLLKRPPVGYDGSVPRADIQWWLLGTSIPNWLSGWRNIVPKPSRNNEVQNPPTNEDITEHLLELLRWCRRHGHPTGRLMRASFMLLVFVALIVALLAFSEPLTHSVRGIVSYRIFVLIWIAAGVVVHLFNFLVLDACWLCREVVIHLPSNTPTYASEDAKESMYANSRKALLAVGEYSRCVLQSTLYPAALIALLLISASAAFEQWAWSTASVSAFAVSGSIVIFSAFMLRRSASDYKQRICAFCTQCENRAADESARQVWARRRLEFQSYSTGACGPLMETPALKAVLIPFGGLGAFEIARLFFGL